MNKVDLEIVEVDELPLNPIRNRVYSINSKNIGVYTHSFFKYPCKFIPHIPRWAIKKYLKGDGAVLDPFCGSGTTLVEGIILGKNSYGIDIDPFGRMLTLGKTERFSEKEVIELEKIGREIVRKSKDMKFEKKYIPPIPNIEHWFSQQSIESLASIKKAIKKYSLKSKYENFFYIVFASIIRKASKADEASPKPYISSRFGKKQCNVFDLFEKFFDKYLIKIKEFSAIAPRKNISKIVGNDARKFKKMPESISLAITSPPYINAFDYVRTLKLENYWLDLVNEEKLLTIRSNSVGTETIAKNERNKLVISDIESKKLRHAVEEIAEKDKRRSIVVTKYFEDLALNLQEVYKSLKKDGVYVIVVADSNIRNVEVPTHEILCELGKKTGFVVENIFAYVIKNRYLRIPREGRGGFMHNDWIICLKKK